jgi:hypothetical protein
VRYRQALNKAEQTMQILFYSRSGNESGNRLKKILDQELPEGTTEFLQDLNDLMQRLRLPTLDLQILIFMPMNRNEMFAIAPLLTDTHDLRLVLVVPDGDNETIAMAHSLRPRYLTYSNGNYSELIEVMMKMIRDSSNRDSGLHRP